MCEKGAFCVGNFETDAYKVFFTYHICGQICKVLMIDTKVYQAKPTNQEESDVSFWNLSLIDTNNYITSPENYPKLQKKGTKKILRGKYPNQNS